MSDFSCGSSRAEGTTDEVRPQQHIAPALSPRAVNQRSCVSVSCSAVPALTLVRLGVESVCNGLAPCHLLSKPTATDMQSMQLAVLTRPLVSLQGAPAAVCAANTAYDPPKSRGVRR